VIVHIGPGEYIEKLKIERGKPFVTFLGSPSNMPTLSFDGTARKYGTVYSATLEAEADYFVAANIIIKVCSCFIKYYQFPFLFTTSHSPPEV
jgi:pectinesterase